MGKRNGGEGNRHYLEGGNWEASISQEVSPMNLGAIEGGQRQSGESRIREPLEKGEHRS